MPYKVLFLCTSNSCRSQMAEGWARYLKSDRIKPYSAGAEKRIIDPFAVKVMAEVGIDISGQKSKLINELEEKDFDYVVTICDDALEKCPIFHGKTKQLHHAFDNPPELVLRLDSEQDILRIYRRVRDEIRAFVDGMPENLNHP